jgi:anti-sigma B factor antagonist
MTMKAQVRTDASGNITVHVEGGLDYENTVPFKKELEGLVVDNPASTITIDMHRLDFVGSSGIGFFVETIKAINNKRSQIRLSNVKPEFQRVFKLYELDMMELLMHEFDCDETEDLSQRFANRRSTYEN